MDCGLRLSLALDTKFVGWGGGFKLVFVSDTQTKPQRLLLLSNLYVSGELFLALSASLALLSFAFECVVPNYKRGLFSRSCLRFWLLHRVSSPADSLQRN